MWCSPLLFSLKICNLQNHIFCWKLFKVALGKNPPTLNPSNQGNDTFRESFHHVITPTHYSHTTDRFQIPQITSFHLLRTSKTKVRILQAAHNTHCSFTFPHPVVILPSSYIHASCVVGPAGETVCIHVLLAKFVVHVEQCYRRSETLLHTINYSYKNS